MRACGWLGTNIAKAPLRAANYRGRSIPHIVSRRTASASVPLSKLACAPTVYDIESSSLDMRSFRGLLLPNGLRVLLASDPDTPKAAAAMDVQVGYMNDPPEMAGLAHFCEHMLFLGTKRYPQEGDFEKFLSAAGGSNNAYTAAEETCYYFDCQGGALEGALSRFSQFFQASSHPPAYSPRSVLFNSRTICINS